jgi:hypothetical protein
MPSDQGEKTSNHGMFERPIEAPERGLWSARMAQEALSDRQPY